MSKENIMIGEKSVEINIQKYYKYVKIKNVVCSDYVMFSEREIDDLIAALQKAKEVMGGD